MILLFWSYLSHFKSDFDGVKNNEFNVANLNYSPIPAWAELGPAQPQLVPYPLSLILYTSSLIHHLVSTRRKGPIWHNFGVCLRAVRMFNRPMCGTMF